MCDVAATMLSRTREKTAITIPDMFQIFLKDEPRINPLYAEVKSESEEWLNRFCSFSPEMCRKINKCDFSYFCSVAAPDANRTELRTLCDWGNWVFPYDDMFDYGEYKNQPDAASRVMESLMETMWGNIKLENKLKIVQAHDSIFFRMAKTSSQGIQMRFANAMHAYCAGALKHVDSEVTSQVPSLEEMILTRRRSAGVAPLYHLVEYAHKIKLPEFIFRHALIQELQSLGIDMVSISNDIISYQKEKEDGVSHNLVAICEAHGSSTQEAFNTVGCILQDCYDRWVRVEQHLPQWGSPTDEELRSYIDGIKNVVRANLYWSFRSGRYFGEDAETVRRSRVIEVLTSTQ